MSPEMTAFELDVAKEAYLRAIKARRLAECELKVARASLAKAQRLQSVLQADNDAMRLRMQGFIVKPQELLIDVLIANGLDISDDSL